MAQIALVNPAQVRVEAISDICVAASLPAGEIRLIIGDPDLPHEFQGVTVPRAFLDNSFSTCFGLKHHLNEQWDCGICISVKWGQLAHQYPAYFAYLLGHEFGHATTALTDLGITIYEDLIRRYIQRVVPDRIWRWDDLPHEIAYDGFGVAVSEEIFGRKQVEEEFSRLVDNHLLEDDIRLRKALDVPSSIDLTRLRLDLAIFSLPYKSEFVRLWDEDREAGLLRIAARIPRLDVLWDGVV